MNLKIFDNIVINGVEVQRTTLVCVEHYTK